MTEKVKRPPTPAWMLMREAARGWRVTRGQALRIVRKYEAETGRSVHVRGRIRTVDFLAIPRGDVHAAPMLPEVADMQAEISALWESHTKLAGVVGAMKRALEKRA